MTNQTPANPLTIAKKALADHLAEILTEGLPAETVQVLPYEPRDVAGGQITVTVTPSNIQPDYLTFVTRIYCPFPDVAEGQERLDAAVSIVSDELASDWMDPVWQFGWNERHDVFSGEAIIAYPRGMS